jgi:methionine-rich copper-binding protein CopC
VSQGGVRRRVRTVSGVLFAALALAGFLVTDATLQAVPAAAHARVVRISPENHAHIETPPEQVTLELESKPVTVEGDPLRVYGPNGERVDAGDVQLVDRTAEGETAALTVTLPPDRHESRGEYHVVYRVVSDDTHLVAGRVMYHYGEAEGTSLLPFGASPDDVERFAPGWPADSAHWPKLVFAAGVGVALGGVVVQRWRRTRRDRVHGARVLSAGLLAGRRLD